MSGRLDGIAKREVTADSQRDSSLELRSEWQQALRLVERSQMLVEQSRHLMADAKMVCGLTEKLAVHQRSRTREPFPHWKLLAHLIAFTHEESQVARRLACVDSKRALPG
jgi:hypothetical protein